MVVGNLFVFLPQTDSPFHFHLYRCIATTTTTTSATAHRVSYASRPASPSTLNPRKPPVTP